MTGVVCGRTLGLWVMGTLIGTALLGPCLLPFDPALQNLAESLVSPTAGVVPHWLGTDVLGRSVLVRLAHASRLSLGMALLSALAAALPGVLLGAWAAWRGGVLDRGLSLLADAVLSVPALLLVLLCAALVPGGAGALYAGLSLSLWVEFFRVSRAVSRPVWSGDAVQAARLLGLSWGHVLRHHWWPAVAPVLSTLLAFSTAQAVLALAALGFIGVGLQPPAAELGLMMTEALPHYQEAPWLLAAPVTVLMLAVLSLLLLLPAAGAPGAHHEA